MTLADNLRPYYDTIRFMQSMFTGNRTNDLNIQFRINLIMDKIYDVTAKFIPKYELICHSAFADNTVFIKDNCICTSEDMFLKSLELMIKDDKSIYSYAFDAFPTKIKTNGYVVSYDNKAERICFKYMKKVVDKFIDNYPIEFKVNPII